MQKVSEKPHRKLVLWQKGITLSKNIYEITKKFPDTEKFGLISQLRRASVSVPTNVAEGAGRNNKGEFIHFLGISNGSISEIDTLTEIAYQLEYMDREQYEQISKELDTISALNNGLLKKLKTQ